MNCYVYLFITLFHFWRKGLVMYFRLTLSGLCSHPCILLVSPHFPPLPSAPPPLLIYICFFSPSILFSLVPASFPLPPPFFNSPFEAFTYFGPYLHFWFLVPEKSMIFKYVCQCISLKRMVSVCPFEIRSTCHTHSHPHNYVREVGRSGEHFFPHYS